MAASAWYQDPEDAAMLRWFDGVSWTEERRSPKHLGLANLPEPTGLPSTIPFVALQEGSASETIDRESGTIRAVPGSVGQIAIIVTVLALLGTTVIGLIAF